MLKLVLGDVMNNRGFTLIEMLAVIVILVVIGGIAISGVWGAVANSKKKSEAIFVKKVGSYIESYINYSGSKLGKKNNNIEGYFSKCKVGANDCRDVEFQELNSFYVLDITNNNKNVAVVNKDSLINPVNKKVCFDEDHNPIVRVFRDDDYVYYYYVMLDKNDCSIASENEILTNIPANLGKVINEKLDVKLKFV